MLFLTGGAVGQKEIPVFYITEDWEQTEIITPETVKIV